MRRCLQLMALSVLAAQTLYATSARAQDSTAQRRMDDSTVRRRVLCDPALAEAAEARHHRAEVFAGVTTVAGLTLPATFIVARSGSYRWIPVAFVGMAFARQISTHMLSNTADQPAAWDDLLEQFKAGETRTADVRACLGKPSTVTKQLVGADSGTASSDETWTYTIRRASLIPFTGSTRTVTITFRGGVLLNVRRTEASR